MCRKGRSWSRANEDHALIVYYTRGVLTRMLWASTLP